MKFRSLVLGSAAAFGILLTFSAPSFAATTGSTGFGDGIPLRFAVKEIVPQGKSITFGKGVDVDIPVTWSGEGEWRDTLNQLARDNHLVVRYDAGAVVITRADKGSYGEGKGHAAYDYKSGNAGFVIVPLDPDAQIPVEEASNKPMPVADSVEDGLNGKVAGSLADGVPSSGKASMDPIPNPGGEQSEKRQVAQAGKPAPIFKQDNLPTMDGVAPKAVSAGVVKRGEWIVPPEGDIQDALYDWGKAAGWTVVWNSDYTYRAQAGAVFKGDFLEAVKTLFVSLESATPPLYPTIWKGNQVIEVKNSPDR